MHRLRFFSLFVCLLAVCVTARAQTGNAGISGRVVDHSGAVIQKAEVSIRNLDTGTSIRSQTNDVGIYTFPSVKPGNYVMRVEKQGFQSVDVTGLTLYTQDQLARNFSLEVGSSSESITVTGGTTNDSPAVSMTVDREFIENMPLNGRSFQDLIQLAPGTVSNQEGYYSINGQRTNGNNFTVDGVSANLGGINNHPGGDFGLSGSSPSQTVLGTTQSLAAVDSLQEFTIQTSGYTAEYGRNPGGQVAFTTRSGTNELHGTLFDYLRNEAFDANSYYNNYYGEPKAGEHQNDFGGTVGGPLVIPRLYNGKNRTFYFFSYEGLRLILPSSEIEYVPTEAFRRWASPNSQPYLNSAPLPNPTSPGNNDGCTIPDPTSGQPTACDALFTYSYSYPTSVDNISIRVDHNLSSKSHAFLRYATTPSSSVTGAENLRSETINSHTWTAGLTTNITPALLNEFRFNFSHDGESSTNTLKSLAGSVPLPRNLVIAPGFDGPYAGGDYAGSVSGTSLRVNANYQGSATVQHQYQIVDSATWNHGKHSIKLGADWRRLTPIALYQPYDSYVTQTNLTDIQQGYASTVLISAGAPGTPVFDNLSSYIQDHWKVNSSLNIDYGVRWEFNPPPGASNGHYPAVLTSGDLATAQIAPPGTPPYHTTYDHFAPRFGFMWNALPSTNHAVTVRGGVGIFYDTGQTEVGTSYYSTYPFYVSGATQKHVSMPLSAAALAPPSLNITLTPPYPYLPGLTDVDLTLPYTEQWNLSVDGQLSAHNTLTVSYVGNNGKKLLYGQNYFAPPNGNSKFTFLTFTSNGSQSSYNALQVMEQGRLRAGLDLIASFTLAHALDNISTDFAGDSPVWGNSDYDLRRVFNLALNYQSSAVGSNRLIHALTRDWLIANRFSAQSGYPVNIVQTSVTLPNGTNTYYFPDLKPGVPLYLHGRSADLNGVPVPGNWRLNRAAFACTTTGATSGACAGTPTRQGTLGRNYVREGPFWTLNTAVQRSFPLYEQVHLNFRVDAFNIFNHPNLGQIQSALAGSAFGTSNGVATTIGSSNELYSMGSARSLQVSLKLQF